MTKTLSKTLKTSKADSAFLYFVLESNEGLCFYSTLDESLGHQYRLIKINYTPEFETQVTNLIDHCNKSIEIEVL